jgi:hypothetical protein
MSGADYSSPPQCQTWLTIRWVGPFGQDGSEMNHVQGTLFSNCGLNMSRLLHLCGLRVCMTVHLPRFITFKSRMSLIIHRLPFTQKLVRQVSFYSVMHHSLSVIRFHSLWQGQKTLLSSALMGQIVNYTEQFIRAFDVPALCNVSRCLSLTFCKQLRQN